MPARHVRSRVLLGLGIALLLPPLALSGPPSASAAPALPTAPLSAPRLQAGLSSSKLQGKLARPSAERRSVFVRLSGTGAAETAGRTLRGAGGARASAGRAAARDRRARVRRNADTVAKAARRVDDQAETLFSVTNAIPGVAISVDDHALEALAERDDVVSIAALVPKKPDNASTAQLTRAVRAWRTPRGTGKGITIGIIDTGIDYTHAAFGGPGTVAAYEDAREASSGPFTPTAKVVGGRDFVGDDYNADSYDPDGYQPVPAPDRNPIDCDGHGTHVAGTAAGFGVTAGGSTFRGSYSTLTRSALTRMRIGPGMAPRASLYALKVFGCDGSTNAVIPALDWSLDPNGDGDFSDHLDIVNLSLGSDYSPADDPQNAVVDAIARHGVLPVMAAGNAGDLTDVGASAVRGLAVASSVDEFQLRDGLRVTAPAELSGITEGQMSSTYDWSQGRVGGDVVALSADNADGCAELSPEDRARVDGKVAWLEWDDDDATRACGSRARADHLAAAGAVGALLTSKRDIFPGGIAGNDVLPVVQLPRTGTDRLRPAVRAGTLCVTFDGTLAGAVRSTTPQLTDTLSSTSARGSHGAPGVVKPDVTAPGDTLTSAGMGTGNGQLTLSGTSMASPVAAGIAALVLKRHPSWSPAYVKAAVMNTATHDLHTSPGRKGRIYGPARVGAGRVDALHAVSTKVIAYSLGRGGAVSASFGVVEAPANRRTVRRTRTVRVRNTGRSTTRVKLGYQAVVRQPGVSYAVSKSSVKLKPGRYADVKVTMRVRTAALRHTIDPTMARRQVDPDLQDQDGNPVRRARQHVSDASGRLLVTPAGKRTLRVPVYGAAKPVSRTRVVDRRSALEVRGQGFDLGRGRSGFQSKLSVTTLGFDSPRQPSCGQLPSLGCAANASARSGDLRYVGAGAVRSPEGSRADGMLWFAVTAYGPMATVGASNVPYVDIDTTGDGAPDFEVYGAPSPGTDLFSSVLVDYESNTIVDVQPMNFLDGDEETNVFDTEAVLLPVWPAALGMTDEDETFPITYTVATFNSFASPLTSYTQDATPEIAFDVAAPGVEVAGALYPDMKGTTIPYTVSPTASRPKALVVHLHNQNGRKAEIQTLTPGSGSVSAALGRNARVEAPSSSR